ncbi:TIGR03435 family protein [Granulicella tundricola]|nr:TIGR03435 family protein [Granulicella tundricola]
MSVLMLALGSSLIGLHAAAQTAATAPHTRGDISGDWQGTLQVDHPLRLVARFAKADKGFTGKMYSIDQGGQGFSASAITVDASTVKFTIEVIGGTYEGTLSADGNSIAGNWLQGPNPVPLTLVRATKETAWEIPPVAPPPKLMAADADPSFEVATIKPNDTGATGMQGLTVNGRNFQTRASSLGDLISFAYEVQSKQIVGAPDWVYHDRYDIAAVPDVDGAPNPAQIRLMIKKLLKDRFKLTFHQDKKELSAYVLTVAKSGSKVKETELQGSLPGINIRPSPKGLTLIIRNGQIADFTGFLQILVLDRPVVDHTALPAKYDFSVTFTPDDSQFNGHPPPLPAKTDAAESAPNLFEAMQQQLGWKLEAEKTPVDVMAIDHVEKPSAN